LQMLAKYTPTVYTIIMTQSTVFKTNKTQAVRIPKSLAFPDHVKKVNVVPQGEGLLILPVEQSWAEFFKSPGIGDDFERPPQPPMQIREDDRD
jgi:antitoxin VapB